MRNKGFTLLEILVAATIVAVLSVAAIVSYSSVNKRSRDARRKSDLEQVRSALEMYRTDNGFYPGATATFSTLDTLQATLVSSYLPAIPPDPQNTAATPVSYYYSPMGSGPPFFSYCVCAKVESDAGSNTCGTTNGGSCNYYLKNP